MFALLHNLDQPCKAKANDVKKDRDVCYFYHHDFSCHVDLLSSIVFQKVLDSFGWTCSSSESFNEMRRFESEKWEKSCINWLGLMIQFHENPTNTLQIST